MPGQLKSGKIKAKANFSKTKIAIVVADWNEAITDALYVGAKDCLLAHGVKKSNIIKKSVPGTFELTLGSLWMAEKKDVDAVIAIGCVIQGDTPHFDYICQAVSYGITEVNVKTKKPVVFGVLTVLTEGQALERAGGKLGNKGEEAALTALSMLKF
jgi:6,7-dimethyl-8-ribityllumazine synthase